MVLLAYVIREEVTPVATCPDWLADHLHSKEYGLVKADLVARASHTYSLYHNDNAKVYFKLEKAMCGAQYSASIKLYQRACNGRSS